ncbi:MAG: flagellar biosynthesis protein FlhB [Spirochaetae bacterium HGW-Spirochaetae-1]|nr:MAG: flagellar biosynthesis protein FlhB [Spirochaetae bacterium HGW-Spirochaetae-1]
MSQFLETYYGWSHPDLQGFVFNLQLFGAEDEGRTEEPTEKKLREARDKGQVAKTQELAQTLVVIFGILVVFIFGAWIYDSLAGMTRYYLSSFSRMEITSKSIQHDFFSIVFEMTKILMPIFGVVVFAAIIGNVIQVGFQVSTDPLKWDWSKLKFDPATVLKKIFFSKQVAMNLFKSIFKVLAIGFVAYLIIVADFEEIMATPDFSLAMALKITMLSGLKIILWTSVLLLLLSVPDYFFQKQEFIESLKMTKQELKEEYKETQGDPYLKARLREMQRELVMKNMIRDVPRADVVVTNPTHFAVALQYDKETMEAPTLIAKGADSMALKIRQVAKENNVPIMENRPLAQQIYKDVEVGDIIPGELFYAVSLVYAELYKKNQYQEAI